MHLLKIHHLRVLFYWIKNIINTAETATDYDVYPFLVIIQIKLEGRWLINAPECHQLGYRHQPYTWQTTDRTEDPGGPDYVMGQLAPTTLLLSSFKMKSVRCELIWKRYEGMSTSWLIVSTNSMTLHSSLKDVVPLVANKVAETTYNTSY